jgi:hypothetical protein
MRTVVTLLCDARATTHQLVSSRATDPCLYTLTIRSAGACPLCSNRSFVKTRTDCNDASPATRTTFFDYAFRNGTITRDALCVASGLAIAHDGDPRPEREIEECPWASISLGNGFDTNWLILGVIVLLTLLLIVVSVCALISRSRIATKYERLQGTVSSQGAHGGARDDVELRGVASVAAAQPQHDNDIHPAVSRIVADRAKQQQHQQQQQASAQADAAAVAGRGDNDDVALRPAAGSQAASGAATLVVDYNDDGESPSPTDDRKAAASAPVPADQHAV